MSFPAIAGHKPDVLDIALIRLPQLSHELVNLNELSSDHNPVLIILSDSPITSSPPITSICINWSKYMATIDCLSPPVKPPIRTSQDIGEALAHLNTSIVNGAHVSSYIKNNRTYKNALPTEIVEEIISKIACTANGNDFMTHRSKDVLITKSNLSA